MISIDASLERIVQSLQADRGSDVRVLLLGELERAPVAARGKVMTGLLFRALHLLAAAQREAEPDESAQLELDAELSPYRRDASGGRR